MKNIFLVDSMWLDDLYADLTIPLLNWYKLPTISIILNGIGPISGLRNLLWSKTRADEDIAELLDVLINNNLVPPVDIHGSRAFRNLNPVSMERELRFGARHVNHHVPHQSFLNHEKETTNKLDVKIDLLPTLVLSGRVGLLNRFISKPLNIFNKMLQFHRVELDHLRDQLINEAIWSSNINMLLQVEACLPKTKRPMYGEYHALTSIAVSDEMADYVVPKVYADNKLPWEALEHIFGKAAQRDTLDRAYRFLFPPPEVVDINLCTEDILDSWYRSFKNKRNTKNIYIVIKWLQERNFLTQETATHIFKDILLYDIADRVSHDAPDVEFDILMEDCPCAAHELVRILQNEFGYSGLRLEVPRAPKGERGRRIQKIHRE